MFIASHSRRKGFSLIEIVIALGIISFALVAILGLLGVLFTTSRSATDDTLIAEMAQQVLDNLQSQPFDNQTLNYTFTADGALIDSQSSSGFNSEPFYKCTVTDDKPSTLDPRLARNFHQYTLTFEWPENASHKNTYSLFSSTARYE